MPLRSNLKFYHYLVTKFYDQTMRKVERLCLGRWRTELLENLDGEVLEIGAGTGVNLRYYSPQIKRLVLCEPDPAMRKQLEKRVQASGLHSAEISSCTAESLDVPDASIDHLVSTLVFCSVADPRQAMQEAFRVLKPGGKLLFVEHVAARKNSNLYFWQQFCQPVWKRLACNCHLTRQTARLLEESGFKLELRHEVMQGAPSIAKPLIVGQAIRP